MPKFEVREHKLSLSVRGVFNLFANILGKACGLEYTLTGSATLEKVSPPHSVCHTNEYANRSQSFPLHLQSYRLRKIKSGHSFIPQTARTHLFIQCRFKEECYNLHLRWKSLYFNMTNTWEKIKKKIDYATSQRKAEVLGRVFSAVWALRRQRLPLAEEITKCCIACVLLQLRLERSVRFL